MSAKKIAIINRASLTLSKQLRLLLKEPNDHFSVGLVDEEDIFRWEVIIVGPRNTLYEGGLFKALLTFPHDYPDNPPQMRFISPMWHPNIAKDGNVCISILHHPNAETFGYEDASQRWSPVHSVETIVMSVISMLSDPNVESPANLDAAIELRNNYAAYETRVMELARKTLED